MKSIQPLMHEEASAPCWELSDEAFEQLMDGILDSASVPCKKLKDTLSWLRAEGRKNSWMGGKAIVVLAEELAKWMDANNNLRFITHSMGASPKTPVQ